MEVHSASAEPMLQLICANYAWFAPLVSPQAIFQLFKLFSVSEHCEHD